MSVPSARLLTNRQRAVLLLAANGNTNADIARWTGTRPNSVAQVLTTTYRALGVRDRAQAVAVALRLGEVALGDVRVPVASRLQPQQAREGPPVAA
ncbi:response regulator transcription factor [Streptomyces sp. NPDC058653]|uniref:response regulator transcription factor n=1 Tax=Streptomyces sp. NPDC058653 TaxID=3346576 RepID=UPI003648C81C